MNIVLFSRVDEISQKDIFFFATTYEEHPITHTYSFKPFCIFGMGLEVKGEMYHDQDCCENVYIEDIVGDLNDLLNEPILMAEEVESNDEQATESATWTFYKLATIYGNVTIRWYGESNGYYSESVSFYQVSK